MKGKILISIIIPLYNTERYIAETIETVTNQTYTNWELIIVDDCSTDNSVEIINKFIEKDSRIKIISSEKNFGGPARPRNIGIEKSNGEYIAFLDADDLWSNDKLEKQLEYMLKHDITFSSTNSMFVDELSNPIDNKYKIVTFFKKYDKKATVCDLIKNKFIATSSVMVKKELLGDFSESKELVSVEDLRQWLHLLHNKKVKYFYFSEKLLIYRILKNSVSNRTIEHKQTTKANLAILEFIVKNNAFNYVPCFYKNIAKLIWIDRMKKILRKVKR